MNISNATSEDVLAQIELIWGKQRETLYKVVPFTIIYVAIFVVGVVGNVCTCIVISRNRYMHTTTNYYLFNLAVSDFLLVSLLPVDIYQTWSAYPWISATVMTRKHGRH